MPPMVMARGLQPNIQAPGTSSGFDGGWHSLTHCLPNIANHADINLVIISQSVMPGHDGTVWAVMVELNLGKLRASTRQTVWRGLRQAWS